MSEPSFRYDIVVLAGHSKSTPAVDGDYIDTPKSLVPLVGLPMIAYVLDALLGSTLVERIVVVGLGPAKLDAYPHLEQILFVPDSGSLIDNCVAGVHALGAAGRIGICSADIPLLTSEAVDDTLRRCTHSGADLNYVIVRESSIEERYPNSGRSFRHLMDGSFAGGDLNVVSAQLLERNIDFALSLANQRKSAWGLAKVMGVGVIVRMLLKRLRIVDLERRASQVMGGRCEAIISDYPELAMDVDKPHQLEIARQVLSAKLAQ